MLLPTDSDKKRMQCKMLFRAPLVFVFLVRGAFASKRLDHF
jgi:hypothetical protein